MKKILLLAGTCAALAACNLVALDHEQPIEEQKTATAFVAGQQVRLAVGAAADNGTKARSHTNGNNIDFTWEEGDQMLIKVGSGEDEKTAVFTLEKGAGERVGYFVGTMPAAGDTFTALYPTTEPDLFKQDYFIDPIPHDKMLFCKSECTLDQSIQLEPQFSALRLNLWGQTGIGKIVVTDHTQVTMEHRITYELNCKPGISDGVYPGGYDNPTSFYIVLYPGTINFSVDVYDTEETPSIFCSFEKAEGTTETFLPGKYVNMPAPPKYGDVNLMPTKLGQFWWAPVNCGYDKDNHLRGQLYQFGRAVGCGLEDEEGNEQTLYEGIAPGGEPPYRITDPEDGIFYKSHSGDASTGDWYVTTRNVMHETLKLTSWPKESPEGTTGIADPCPEGWRVPGKDAFYLSGLVDPSTNKVLGTWKNNGCDFGNGLFLPAAGWRYPEDDGFHGDGSFGYYWTLSTTDEDLNDFKAGYIWFTFEEDLDKLGGDLRFSAVRQYGQSVRCVKYEIPSIVNPYNPQYD